MRGKHVLELGSGTGLSGLVAACLGAASVSLSDLPNGSIFAPHVSFAVSICMSLVWVHNVCASETAMFNSLAYDQ